MYTQCPECQTVFRISDEQLAAAGGKVRCGRCMNVFPALEHQVADPSERMQRKAPARHGKEQPRAAPATPEPTERTGTSLSEASSHAEKQIEDPRPDQGASDTTAAERAVQSIRETGKAGTNLPPDLPFLSEPEEATERKQATLSFAETQSAKPEEPPRAEEFEADTSLPPNLSTADHLQTDETPAEEPLPTALRPPQRKGSGLLAVLFWSLASLLMLAVLASQYGYYQRYELAKNPTVRPWLERMCTYIECRLPPRRDTAAFSLTSRDVRYHPEYADALLISGTFINGAAFPQPYPTVEVLLKDVNGDAVAGRRFAPEQYLKAPSATGKLLPTGTEAQLILEVSDPGNQAVSFEFNFL